MYGYGLGVWVWLRVMAEGYGYGYGYGYEEDYMCRVMPTSWGMSRAMSRVSATLYSYAYGIEQ